MADRLVDEFEARLREVELVVGMRVMASWADAAQLSLHEARLILVLATSTAGSTAVALADLGGIDIADVYPALGQLKDRGLVREAQKGCYLLTDHGEESLASLNAARREGITAYVVRLEDDERRSLEAALGVDGSV
jgi:DNA-binding MarR family transcriptional regulator